MRKIAVGIITAVMLLALIGPANAQQATQRQFHGDKAVVQRLIRITAALTGQTQADVTAQLEQGASIASIAQSHGSSADAILARFDRAIDQSLARAVENGRLPQSVSGSRAAWYKRSARLQVDQAGLTPRFPGLHELHGVVISAAVRTSGVSRAAVREQLLQCSTISAIVAEAGSTDAAVQAQAMQSIDARLNAEVDAGSLSPAQRDSWRAALETSVAHMIQTPGLHVAGKTCAK